MSFFLLLCILTFLVELFYFFTIKSDGIINTAFLKFVDITDCLVGTVCAAFALRIVKALIDLKVSPFLLLVFLRKYVIKITHPHYNAITLYNQ